MAYLFRPGGGLGGAEVDRAQDARLAALEGGTPVPPPRAYYRYLSPKGGQAELRVWPAYYSVPATTSWTSSASVGYDGSLLTSQGQLQDSPQVGSEYTPVSSAFSTAGAGAWPVADSLTWDNCPWHQLIEASDSTGAVIVAGSAPTTVGSVYMKSLQGRLNLWIRWSQLVSLPTLSASFVDAKTMGLRVIVIEVDLYKELELKEFYDRAGRLIDFTPGSCPNVTDMFSNPSKMGASKHQMLFTAGGALPGQFLSIQAAVEETRCEETFESNFRQSFRLGIDDESDLITPTSTGWLEPANFGPLPQSLQVEANAVVIRAKTLRQFTVLHDKTFVAERPDYDVGAAPRNSGGVNDRGMSSRHELDFDIELDTTDEYPRVLDFDFVANTMQLYVGPTRRVRYLVMVPSRGYIRAQPDSPARAYPYTVAAGVAPNNTIGLNSTVDQRMAPIIGQSFLPLSVGGPAGAQIFVHNTLRLNYAVTNAPVALVDEADPVGDNVDGFDADVGRLRVDHPGDVGIRTVDPGSAHAPSGGGLAMGAALGVISALGAAAWAAGPSVAKGAFEYAVTDFPHVAPSMLPHLM